MDSEIQPRSRSEDNDNEDPQHTDILQVPLQIKADGSPAGSDSTGSVPSGSTASLPSVITANIRNHSPQQILSSSQSSCSDDEHKESSPQKLPEIGGSTPTSVSAAISVPRPTRIITGFDTPTSSPIISGQSSLPKEHGYLGTRLVAGVPVEATVDEVSSSSSPGKIAFGSLLSQRMSGIPPKQLDVNSEQGSQQKSPQNITGSHKSPLPQHMSRERSTTSPAASSPISLRSFASYVSQSSSASQYLQSQASGGSTNTMDSAQSPTKHSKQSSKKNKKMKLPLKIGTQARHHAMSESEKFEQSPKSIRSLIGSITVWSSRPILSRHLSQGGGSSLMVNYVTEAQSVVPSLSSAFSIDHMEDNLQMRDPVEMSSFEVNGKHRTMSHQDQLDILDILEQNEYVDTVKSTDSNASLLRRSVSVPPQYHYKSQKLHVQDIFNVVQVDRANIDPVTGKPVKKILPPHMKRDDEAWRQTMDDLLEQPEYLDSVESACSRTGLLASQARALAQQYGTKPTYDSPSLSRQSDQSISTKQLKFIYFKNLIVLSLGFFFIFMSYMSLRNLQSSLYKKGGLGIIALSLVYASLFLGCIFATTVVQKLRPKRTIMMCIGGMFLFVLSNFYPTYYTLGPACAITGFCLANLWTAHATYLACVAARYAALVNDKVQNILSQFNGIFFAFFHSSQIIGGLISSLVLTSAQENKRFHIEKNTTNTTEIIPIIMGNISTVILPHCGAKYCSYLDDELETTKQVLSQDMIYMLIGIYAACMMVGFLIIALCLDPLDGVFKKSHVNMSTQLTSVFRFLGQWKVACLLGLMFYTMLQSSFMFGEFTKAFVTCTNGVNMVGYTMVCLSSMSALSSFFSGRLMRYVGRQALFCTSLGIHMILIVVEILWAPGPEHLVIIFIIAGCWGMADGMLFTQAISLFGVLFADNKEPAFAALKMCQAFGTMLLFSSSEYLCTMVKLCILLTFAFTAFVGLQVLEFKLKQEKKVTKSLNIGPTSV